MHIRIALLTISIALATACGVKEDNWSRKSAKASCKFAKRCGTAAFYAGYLDMNDCLDQSEQALDAEAIQAQTVPCIFDSAMAKECLKDLDLSCKKAGEKGELFLDSCRRVWNCGTLALDTGL